MGPNRMWMFPVGFTTRRTNDVPQLFELRVVFVGCTGLEPQRSACTAHRATPAAPRRGPPWPMRRKAPECAELWAHQDHLVRMWSVSVSDVGFCLFAFPPSELSKLQSVQWQCE